MNRNLTPISGWSMLLRFLSYLAVWLVMVGTGFADILPGLAAAGLATWCSLVLLPPLRGPGGVRPLLLVRLLLWFVWVSVLAGLDIARRAFSPSLPLSTGWLVYSSRLPRDVPLNLFMSMASLMPGTLCTGTDDSGDLIVHCLDVGQPVASQLADEEARLAAALGLLAATEPPPGDAPGVLPPSC
jgi:multicomponent Na+:H+ antiporter subunit E